MTELKEATKPRAENGPSLTKGIAPRTPAEGLPSHVSPLGFMRRFAHEMDRMFEEFGLDAGFHVPRLLSRGREMLRREAGFIPADWSPRIDVVERDGNLVVRADLPGLGKDDIKIEITDDLLTIQGERKHETKEEHEGYSYNECAYGSFYRAIPLPEGADTAKATSDFRKGVLEITVPTPSKPAPKARRLEIKEGK